MDRSVGDNRREAVTSPVRDLEPFEDESDLVGVDDDGVHRYEDEEEDGEELFGDNMEAYVYFNL